ncbi:MAG TPA: sigma-70 family RNA polymerase sigma factor, partial [Verrucomicrobiae bacterium]
MQELADTELLRRYTDQNSEEAFAALVARHLNLVYGAALRKTGDPHAGAEITQVVFIILAKKARVLRKETVLAGWLYQTARLTAANFLRSEIRRVRREQEAYMQSCSNENESELWPQIMPLLEDGMGKLREKDRNAIMLRFFEGKSFQEIGATFGASENAAKKRVGHALEKLRSFFMKRGVNSTTAIIAIAISANSVQAAPVALAKSVTAVAISNGAALSGSTLTLIKTTLKLMTWTKAKITVVTVVGIMLAAGTTTIAVHKILDQRFANRILSGESSWQIKGIIYDRKTLYRMPPLLKIVPSKFAPDERLGTVQLSGNRMAGLNQSVDDMIAFAYGYNPASARRVLKTKIPAERYDYINTQGPSQMLQQEIKNEFGLIARRERGETDVWLLRVKRPDAPGLKPTSGQPETSRMERTREGGIHHSAVNSTLSRALGEYLQDHILKVPVIDQTGLAGRYDFDL